MDWPPTPAQRERMILDHYALVRTIACRMVRRLPSNVDVDEMINVGMVGLIDAIDRFDPARAVPFKAYAEIRVRGAIVDALRDADWVPRSVRRKFARLEHARKEFKRRNRRDPSREEMATALEMSVREYEDLVGDARIHTLISLDTPIDDDGGATLVDQVSNDDPAIDDVWMQEELTQEVKTAVGHLPDKERTVVTLYYMRGLNLKDIGDILGVTESRACQLRGQGVKRLRHRLHAFAS